MSVTPGRRRPSPTTSSARVLDVVRQLARETGGARAERAVAASASLEREVGLGSLERVELVARLERAFGRALDDGCLAVDTPAGLARAILEAPAERAAASCRRAQQPAGAGPRDLRRGPDARRVALAARGARARARSTCSCAATPRTQPSRRSATGACATRRPPSRRGCASGASARATPSR